jgi:hypothetical protein
VKVLTNPDIIRIVNKWQTAGFVNVMTCSTDGCKTVLEPIERKGEVLLKCPACAYEEKMIPEVVLNSEARIDGVHHFKSAAKGAKRIRRRKDFMYVVAAFALCAVIFGSLVHPLYGTCVGLLLGSLIVGFKCRKRPRSPH